jgi:tRNA acetyltransferase TAN1
LNRFNLIFSTFRFKEEEAQDEILDLLELFGDHDAVCEITDIRGILLANSRLNPLTVTEKLRQITASEPWQLRYILRALPVMQVVPTSIEDISRAASELGAAIETNQSFRVTVEKRHTSLESMQVVNAVASGIERKVNLLNPDWIILIQILGAQTGLALIKPDQIFSSVVEKRK